MQKKASACSLFCQNFISVVFFMLCSFSVWAQPSFNANFTIDEIGPGSTTTLIYTINNTDPVNPVSDLAFTHILPANVTIATPSQALSECINGLLVAPEGGNTITFTDGRIAAATDCTIQLNVESSVPGTYTHTTGDLTSDAGNSGTATANLIINADRPGFTKSFSPGTVNFGDRSTLTFTIDNTLNTNTANAFVFTDNLPVGMVIADPTGVSTDCPDPITAITAIPGSQQLSHAGAFGVTNLAAGATCSISVDVLALARGRLNNTTSNLTSFSSGFQPENNGMAGDVLMVNSIGDIQLTQSFLDDPVVPGDQVVLEFELTNLNRDFDVTDISFDNDLDATLNGLVATGLPLNNVCGAGSTISGTSLLSLNGASLSPNESCSFSVTLQVPAAASSGVYPNPTTQPTGQITGQPTNGNIATDNLFVNFAPQLSKSFTPGTITAGEATTIEFTITNPSLVDTATEITFTNNLSAFLSGVQISALPATGFCGAGSFASNSLVIGENTLTIAGASLAPGGSCNFSVDLLTSLNTPSGTYTNTTQAITATLSGQTFTGHSASADLTIIETPDLRMNFVGDPILPGDTFDVVYRISGSEEGNLNATNISFSHDLDLALTGLEAVGLPLNDVCGVGSQLSGTGLITFTNGSIVNGAACEFTITLQVPLTAPTGIYNSTTSALTAVVGGMNTTSNTATDTFTISSLAFSHQFIDDPSLPGETVTVEYTIENLDPVNDTTGMVFTHNLSAVLPGLAAGGLSLTDPCGLGSQFTGTTFLIFNGGNLAAGSSCTFSASLDIPLTAINNNYNSATSTLTATLDGNSITTPASNDTLIIDNNLIFFSKEFTDNPAIPGNTTTLEFTLVNGGDDNMSGLNFTDDLDAVLGGLVATGLPLNDVCGLGSQISGTNLLNFTGGNIPVGSDCTFSVDVVVPNGTLAGAYQNVASEVNGMMSGLPVMGDPARDELLVGFFSLTKFFDGPVFSGDTAVLSFTITNNDTNTISDLSFTDDLDAVLSGLTAVAPLPINPCGAGSQISGISSLSFIGGQLAANSSCTFAVTVQIPAGLNDSTVTNITSDLIQTGVPLAAPAIATLEVMGVPVIDVSPLTVNFGDIEVGNTSALQTVTISNTGLGDLNISNLPNVSVDVSPAITQAASGTCSFAPFVLAPGSSCTLNYEFTPTTAGAINGISSITSNSTGSTTDTDLTFSGTGIQAVLNLNPNPLDFGFIELNTTGAAATLTLTNNGDADLDVTSMTAATGDFSLDNSTCGALPFSLTPASSCTISYQFTPTSTGLQTQAISFVSDSATTPDVATLQGEGVQASLSLSATQVNFPNTTINTTANEQLITITNNGLIDLQINTLTAALAPFNLTGGSCTAPPFVLTLNATCTLGYSFSPTATGNFDQTLNIGSNAASSPDNFELVGTGIEPGLQLSDATLDFQSINIGVTSAPLSISISNTGTADLIISNISVPALPFTVTGGSCGNTLPITLANSESCTLDYQFAPTTTGNINQTITLQSNASTSPDSFELTGIGVEPVIQLSDISLGFPSINIGSTSAPMDITISNTGTADLIISGVDVPNIPFSLSGGNCGSTFPIILSASQTCSLEYQFAPTTAGNFNQTIDIQSNASTTPNSFNLTGVGVDEITLITSDDELTFDFTFNGDIQSQSLNLSSGGLDDVIISTISIPTSTFINEPNTQTKSLGSPFSVDFSDCGPLPIVLSNGESCEVVITYITEDTPSNSSFTIISNDPGSPLVINLRGTGITDPISIPTISLFGLAVLFLILLMVAYRKTFIQQHIQRQ